MQPIALPAAPGIETPICASLARLSRRDEKMEKYKGDVHVSCVQSYPANGSWETTVPFGF